MSLPRSATSCEHQRVSAVRVFIASSLDGFMAADDDDLSWLPPPTNTEDHGYRSFMAQIGALLIGRRTYDVASGFGEWPYEELPVLVATHRTLAAQRPTVRAVTGSIQDLVARAQEAASGRDVYLDGGSLIRQALDSGLVSELTVTLVPVVLGRGHPLFAGSAKRHRFALLSTKSFDSGLVQLVYRPCLGEYPESSTGPMPETPPRALRSSPA